MARALATNTALTKLTLRENYIGCKGATEVAAALKANSALTLLRLQDNGIGSDGATNLAQSLKANCALVRLNVGANEIGDEGATALAEALDVNAALRQLLLQDNGVSLAGAEHLADSLSRNTTLAELDVRWNGAQGSMRRRGGAEGGHFGSADMLGAESECETQAAWAFGRSLRERPPLHASRDAQVVCVRARSNSLGCGDMLVVLARSCLYATVCLHTDIVCMQTQQMRA